MRLLFAFGLLFIVRTLSAQDIAGRWTTIDDESGTKKSVVEITVLNGKATGRIVDLYDKGKL